MLPDRFGILPYEEVTLEKPLRTENKGAMTYLLDGVSNSTVRV